MAKTVVGLYDNFTSAQNAVQDLIDTGFARDDISLMANNVTGEYDNYARMERAQGHSGDVTPGEGAGIGAGMGAAIGGIGGLLMGLGLLTVPGVGPALAAGPLVSALAGAGIGAAAGGLAGALVNIGVPEEEAGYYAEGVRRGGTLVTVATDDQLASRAANTLSRHNPVDIEQRRSHWRERGWTGYDSRSQPYTAEEIRREREYIHPPL